MRRHALRVTTVATALLLALAMLPLAAAHAAGVPPGYTRYAHDCSDDYGIHGVGVGTQTAHDGIAIDIIEKYRGGDALVYFRLSFGAKTDNNEDELRETLTFVSPGLNETAKITIASTSESSFTVVADQTTLTPVHVSGALPVFDTSGGTEDDRFSYELGFSYEDLNVTNGQKLTDMQVVTLKKGALDSDFRKADHVPGGTYSNGEYKTGCEAESGENDYFVTSGYTISKRPPSQQDDEDPGTGQGDGAPPTARFTFSPQRPKEGQAVTFSDDSTDADGNIVSRLWEFGDGQSSTEQDPTHTYAVARNYVVRLTVTDDDNNTDTTTQDLRFENQRPVADFSASQSETTVGTTIHFTDESTDPDGTIVSRAWDFGDGNTAGGANVSHAYESSGTYSVTLTVTDSADAKTSTSRTLVITAEEDEAEAPGPAAILIALSVVASLGILRRRD